LSKYFFSGKDGVDQLEKISPYADDI